MNSLTYLNIRFVIENYINTFEHTNFSSYISPSSSFKSLLKAKSLFHSKSNILNSSPDSYEFTFKNFAFKNNLSIVFLDLFSIYDFSEFNFKSISLSNLCFILSSINNIWKIDFIISREIMPNLFNSISKGEISLKQIKHEILNRTKYYNSIISNTSTQIKPTSRTFSNYSSQKAIEYAEKFALNYNPEYRSFDDSGGDCTNFVSQTLHFAGFKKTKTWNPYSNSWVRVQELRNYLVYNNLTSEHFSLDENMSGSVIQFFHNEKKTWTHSGILTFPREGDYLYCCHSYDKLHYPLSLAYPSIYPKIRILKPF
ncbi:MAG: amidase domain-containing protein [Clostridium sp.]|uniref:amidase domain-containing protein n=1 Tax=Clostridium sp. TaxID=1506 RepID=UPI003EE465E2